MAQFQRFSNWLSAGILRLRRSASTLWSRYRVLAPWLQAVIALGILLVLFAGYKAMSGGSAPPAEASLPTVTLAAVSTLTGTGGAVVSIGSVRSITEADILAQSGGTVTVLHASLGQYVSVGSILAELENASQRAAVLQAEGAYEAALASHAGVSTEDIATSARNSYTTAYATLDTLLKSDIDTLFGDSGSMGPELLISPQPFDFSYFPKQRQALENAMNDWRVHLNTASSGDPQTLLAEADRVIRQATALGTDLAQAATKNGSDATSAQLTALATARAGFTTLQTSVTAAKASYQSQQTSATAGADASTKIALGGLRAAQAQLEKTFVRAPISGTVNFFPLHVGDYVAQFTHVATVAQNGALEIVSFVSGDNRALLSIGGKVVVEDLFSASITSISPALDPVTKQVEFHAVLSGKSTLVNGQSVRVALPTSAPVVAATQGPQLLPLTALKLTPSARAVFSVSSDGRLVAHPVEIGEVHGDRIEITTTLPGDLEIVTDARGFSEGQKVTVVR